MRLKIALQVALLAATAVVAVACLSRTDVVEVEVEKVVEKVVEVTPTSAPKGTIISSDFNWTSAQMQNRIRAVHRREGLRLPYGPCIRSHPAAPERPAGRRHSRQHGDLVTAP